jgi:hypothetical protein
MCNLDNDMPGFIGIHLGEMKLVFKQKFKNGHVFVLCLQLCIFYHLRLNRPVLASCSFTAK